MDVTINDQVKNAAMQAFEAFKTELTPKLGKLDAFDEAKFDKVQKQIAEAIEIGQAEKARAKAMEDEQKAQQERVTALETELADVKTAFNRAPAANAEAKELGALRTKAFNDFARTKGKEDFSDYLARRAEEQPELKALYAASDPSGGYLVMPEFGGVVQTKVFESSPLRQLASTVTIGSDSYEVVVDYDEAAASWAGEVSTRSTTNTPTFGKITIPVNELYANPKASQKVLEDAAIDMEAWLIGKVTDIFSRKEATAFVTGSGAGQPKGIMSYDSGTTLSSYQVEQVVSGSASDFTYNGLVDLTNALKEEYQGNAVFLIKRASNANLMKLKDGEGRPIFNMAYDKVAGVRPTIMGKDVYFANDVAAVSSNALAMAYGDFKRAYQIVDRRGVTVLRDPYSDKPNVAFYTTKRVGGGVINCEAYKVAKIST